VVSVGIVVVLIATATLGAACLVGVDRGRKVATPSGFAWDALGRTVAGVVHLAIRRPTAVLIATATLTTVAAWG